MLLRHGETTMGRHVFLGSRQDPGLSDTGRLQARGAASALRDRPLAAVWVSPLRRALETASIAVPGHEQIVDERLRELDFGELSGLSWDQIQARHPELAAAWRTEAMPTPPGGEAPQSFWRRVSAAVLDATGAGPDGEPGGCGGDVLVVAHGGTLRAILATARAVSMRDSARIRPAHARLRTQRVTPIATARWRAVRDGAPV